MMSLVALLLIPLYGLLVHCLRERRIVHAVRNLAMLPGPPALWIGEWVASPSVAFNADDVAQWPIHSWSFG